MKNTCDGINARSIRIIPIQANLLVGVKNTRRPRIISIIPLRVLIRLG
jgi:hypothetical protein